MLGVLMGLCLAGGVACIVLLGVWRHRLLRRRLLCDGERMSDADFISTLGFAVLDAKEADVALKTRHALGKFACLSNVLCLD